MSRTIFAGVLAAGLLFAIGCGSKPEPTVPNVKLEEAPPAGPPPAPAPDPNTGAPKAEPPKVVWEIDPDKHAVPPAPVKGSVSGSDFSPEALIEGAELVFQTFKPGTREMDRSVRLKLAPKLLPGQAIPPLVGRTWKVRPDAAPDPAVPEVWLETVGKGIFAYPAGYALTLELGQRKDGKVPGKVFLSVADDARTVLAGTFEALYVRPHTEPPGPDDVPYVGGAVTLVGAKPDAEVRVGYCALLAGTEFATRELPLSVDPKPVDQAQWTRDESGKSTLVAGDGKDRPFRYEHVKLPAGRYLLTAAVAGGPTAWKWVDVAPGSALTENFALDATKSGGVEVSVPADVKDKVSVVPADAPERPALSADLFRAIALQVARQDGAVVGGKAVVKNLAPGKYEVRAGDLRAFVDVAAGKTAELTLAPPKK